MKAGKIKHTFLFVAALSVAGCDQINEQLDNIKGLFGEEAPKPVKQAPAQVAKPAKPAVVDNSIQTSDTVSGSVTAGDKSIEIKDYSVVYNPGQHKMAVSFYGSKAEVEQGEGANSKDKAKEIDYHFPVFKLWLIFNKDAQICNINTLENVTAIFSKNKSFEFDVKENTPINYSLPVSGDDRMASVGLSKFSCSFEKGGQVDLALKNQWTADDKVLKNLLPAGKKEITFKWDVQVSGNGKVVDKPENAANRILINNYSLKSASITWNKEANVLKVLLFKNDMNAKQRSEAASNPPKFDNKDFVAGYYITYASTPENFNDMPKSVVMEVNNNNAFYSSDIDVSNIYVSGTVQKNSFVLFQSKGTKDNFGGEGNKGVDWNFNVGSQLDALN